MKQTKTKNRCLVTCLTLIAMLMTSIGVKAQTVHIALDNGSLLTGVGPGNDSGWGPGFATAWRHEQLSLTMMGSDRDELKPSGEEAYPSNVYAKHSKITGNDNDKQICIIGGRRPSFMVVSLPKGYRITSYTIVLANDLYNQDFGGNFDDLNTNNEILNGNTRIMRFYETEPWEKNKTNSGTSGNRWTDNQEGYHPDQVRYIDPGTDWENGRQIGSKILAQAVDANGNGNITPSSANNTEFKITRTAQDTGEVDENGQPIYDMGNQLYFRLVKNYYFYGITIKEFRIEFTAEGTFAADVVPQSVGEATSCVASPFTTSKIDFGRMQERGKQGTNITHYAFAYDQIDDLQAFNYLYQDDAIENGAPKDVATQKNIRPVEVNGQKLYALKSDTYFIETPIEIATSGGNAPIGYRIVGALFTPLWGTGTSNFTPGPYKLKIYKRDGSGLMRWTYDESGNIRSTNDANANDYIEISAGNDTDLGKVIDMGFCNNDAIKFEIETTGDTQALVQIRLLLQALDPYIDKMDIVCTANDNVLHLTQSFTADDFSVSGGKFVFYVPEDYYDKELTFTFSDLYSKYGDETYGGSGFARYSFVRSPYFITVDGDGDDGLYNIATNSLPFNYSPDHTSTDKIYTVDAGNIRFKFNNAEDLGGDDPVPGNLQETPFSVAYYLTTTDPGDPMANTSANPNKPAAFIPVKLKASSSDQRSGIFFVFTADETRWNIAQTTAWQHRFYAFYRMEIEAVAKTFTPAFTPIKIYDKTLYTKNGTDTEESMWGLIVDVADTENGQKVQGYLTYHEIISTIQNGRAAVYFTKESDVDAYNARLTGALNSTDPLTADQATSYNSAIAGANKQAGNTLTADEAKAYNAKLPGAKKLNDEKSPKVDPVLVSEANAANGPTSMEQILYIDGTPLYAMLNSAEDQDVITVEDLREHLAKNSLVFLPENTTSTYDNTAYETSTGFHAGKNIVLTDKHPFFSPYDIQIAEANSVTYAREKSGPTSNDMVKYATVVLPFTMRVNNGEHVNDPADGYKFNLRKLVGLSLPTGQTTNYYSEGNFQTISGTQTEANKPYMVEVTATPNNSTNSFVISQKGSTILATPFEKDANGNITKGHKYFKGDTYNNELTNYGTYAGAKVDKDDDDIYYFNKDKFYCSSTLTGNQYVNIRPFRAYYSPDANLTLYSKMIGFYVMYDLFSGDGGITTSLTETSKPKVMTITTDRGSMLINAKENIQVNIMSANGMNVDGFNMNAGEQKQVSLPSGIYIVNNTKILVK